MTNEDLISDILNNWTDKSGAILLNDQDGVPPEQKEQDSENALLFTGEVALLCEYLGLMDNTKLFDSFVAALSLREVEAGIFNRYIDGHHNRGTSWDEYNGIEFLCVALDIHCVREEIVSWGLKHGWTYINENTQAKWWLHLDRVRQPRDRAFYKICAGIRPSIFEILWLAASITLVPTRNKQDTSGKIICWFRWLAIDRVGLSSRWLRLSHSYFDKRMKKLYGEQYMIDVLGIYFKNPWHVIHKLIKMYYEKQT